MKEIINAVGIIIVLSIIAILGFSIHLKFGLVKIQAGSTIIICLLIAVILSYLIYLFFDKR